MSQSLRFDSRSFERRRRSEELLGEGFSEMRWLISLRMPSVTSCFVSVKNSWKVISKIRKARDWLDDRLPGYGFTGFIIDE